MPTKTSTPTFSLPLISEASCANSGADLEVAKTVRVIDDDTIVVSINGSEFPLHYIGIDCPETNTTGAEEATSYNCQLVEDKTVILVKDVSGVDRIDRLLHYVFVDDVFVNYEMLCSGFAVSGSWPPDIACDEVFSTAYANAYANQRGLWIPIETPPVELTGCPSGCITPPPGCLIKGNISSNGEKNNHVPSQAFYDETIITPSKGKRWYYTEQEAINNGWRKAKR